MRCPEDQAALERSPRLYGFPLLLPANRTREGKFIFQGNIYSLPINEPEHNNSLHGLMADAPFTIISRGAEHLTARFENRGERYPFSFDMTIEDFLSGKGINRRLTIRALEDMPFTFGFHATFAKPKTFSVPCEKQYIRAENLIPTGELIDPLPLGETFDAVFQSKGTTAVLDDIIFTVSNNFDHWVLYNSDGKKDFLCVEPQCGQVNGLNIPDGHRTLAAGEEETFTFSVSRQSWHDAKER